MRGKTNFYYHVLRTALSRTLYPVKTVKRSERYVSRQYGANYQTETNKEFISSRHKVIVNGKVLLLSVAEHKRFLLTHFADLFKKFNPDSVLELGSGRGFNLLSLAALLPEVKIFKGIELTAEGVAVARENIANPPIDIVSRITGLSEDKVKRRLSGRDITVTEGSIRKLPFPDRSFDLVFSNSVIEQIPKDYLIVFQEAARVARRVGVFSEPFMEAQQNWLDRLYLKNIDYFRASYKDISQAGWQIVSFEVPDIQKFVFK